MSIYWSKKTKDLLPYVPGEQPKDRKFIKLNTNENPYPPSPFVIEAIKKAALENLRLYPDPDSLKLCQAIAERYGLNENQVFTGNGSDEVLAFSFPAFFEAKDKPLLFPDITYSFYPVYCNLFDISCNLIPLDKDYKIDRGAYVKEILNDNSTGVIFPNPNAPTGILLPLSEIITIAEAVKKKNQVLVIDEAYIAFAEGDTNNAFSAVSLIKDFPNILVVRTMSKEFSLAGLRVGYALGNEELIQALKRVKDSFNSYPMDFLAQTAAVEAIKDRDYYNGNNKKIIATRKKVNDELSLMGFSVLPSDANFIFASPSKSGKSLHWIIFLN